MIKTRARRSRGNTAESQLPFWGAPMLIDHLSTPPPSLRLVRRPARRFFESRVG